jgi:phage terminase large subunit-like protein
MTATLELELAASSVAGYDEPRFMCAPSADLPTRAVEAIELAASAGIELDDWEKLVLVESLRMRASKWAAFEVGVNVPRQNGKNVVLEVREAAGLFCWGERLLQHSAHLFDTSLESFRRLEDFIEAANLGHLVKRVMRSHGEEGFELKTKQRIRFRTRTKGGGRGMTGDTVIFDEAMMLDRLAVRALLPTLTAVANPQVWYTGSAVDQEATQHGHVFADVRRRGLDAEPRLAYFEWSARIGDPEKDNPDELTDELMADVETWAQANPALGIRISQGYLEAEHTALDSRSFAVERLGIGDWPQPDAFDSVIPMERWDELADPASVLIDSPTFV